MIKHLQRTDCCLGGWRGLSSPSALHFLSLFRSLSPAPSPQSLQNAGRTRQGKKLPKMGFPIPCHTIFKCFSLTLAVAMVYNFGAISARHFSVH